jgi:hypothetical protein
MRLARSPTLLEPHTPRVATAAGDGPTSRDLWMGSSLPVRAWGTSTVAPPFGRRRRTSLWPPVAPWATVGARASGVVVTARSLGNRRCRAKGHRRSRLRGRAVTARASRTAVTAHALGNGAAEGGRRRSCVGMGASKNEA